MPEPFTVLRALALGLAGGLACGPAGPAAAEPCGGPDAPCDIAGGSYHIALPPGPGPHPVMVFLHGYGGSGSALMRPGGTSDGAVARGWAYIAPNGLKRPGRDRSSWSFHPLFEKLRDEPAFLRAVLADAATRFGVDPGRAVLAGFSIGGSMTSYIACARPQDFIAYAPVSGSFWRPHPDACAGPVRLLQTHGWRDQVVPLEGRVLRAIDGQEFAQGDVFQAMQIWRAVNGCDNHRADLFATDARFWRRIWQDCAPGTALQLALYDGGHGVPAGWLDLVFDWLAHLPEAPG